jgi:hypothetical protein
MQTSLSQELRGVIAARVRSASPCDLLRIATTLCDESVQPGTPMVRGVAGPRYTVDGDTVHDSRTGLIWTRSTLPGGRRNWADAQTAAGACALGGFSDWRLPTIRELLSIVDYERASPAIDQVFECEDSWYWTGTPYAGSPSACAWGVDFNGGFSGWGHQSYEGFVRAVRPGQLIGHLG